MPRASIVIIEDELSIQQLYKTKMEREGFDVYTANNGQEGLKAVKKYSPNLILLDIRMPVMSGDEMLRRLREEDWGASIRVIVLTNLSKDEAPSILRFLNVDRYIVKAHYTPAQIADVVREVLHLPRRA
jgi:DNA-binding response OmpR family regulator